jgi:hypothetical protein
MSQRKFHAVAALAAAGALAFAISAQSAPAKAKPIAPPPTRAPSLQPVPPAAPPPASPPATGQNAPICHSADFNGHWDSPRSLMASCLNKQVQINTETQNYVIIAVNESGFVLQRTPQDATGQHRGIKDTKYVPWSGVLLYNMVGDFMDIVLVRV